MKYIEIRLNVKANNVSLVTDVIAALLAEAGYDSFVPTQQVSAPIFPKTNIPNRLCNKLSTICLSMQKSTGLANILPTKTGTRNGKNTISNLSSSITNA